MSPAVSVLLGVSLQVLHSPQGLYSCNSHLSLPLWDEPELQAGLGVSA